MGTRRRLSVLVLFVALALPVGIGASEGPAYAPPRTVGPERGGADLEGHEEDVANSTAIGEGALESGTTTGILRAASSVLTWQIETVHDDDAPADLGQHSSLALDQDGRPHVAYYDAYHEDLRYAAYDGSQWISETVDSGGNVGQYASLTLDSEDLPRISYYDATHGNLKVASYDGEAWQTSPIVEDGDVGQFSSLAVDVDDCLHISYYDATDSALKYVRHSDTMHAEQTVDNTGNAGLYSSLALRSNGQPCIAYVSAPDEVKCACSDGKTWGVDPVYDALGRPVSFTSLALTEDNRFHVAFHVGPSMTHMRYALVHASLGGAGWVAETVDSTGVVGQYASVDLDPAGEPHVSYYGDGDLKIAYRYQGNWYTEVVDDDGNVGQYTSLALDDSGQPHIAYHDETNASLKHAFDVPLRFQHLAAQLVAEMRGTGMVSGWDAAELGPGVRPLYRPDVEGVAYYEFPVQPAGFVIVSTGSHDFPIPHWDFASSRPSYVLEKMAEEGGQSAERFFKLDTLAYACEDEDEALAGHLGALPLKATGLPPGLDTPPTSFETIWTPGVQADTDDDTGPISPTVFISGTIAPPDDLTREPWTSWGELKGGFRAAFGPLLDALQEEASEAWGVEELAGGGGVLRKGETRTLATVWLSPTVSAGGEAWELGFVGCEEESTGPGLPPTIVVTALDSTLGEIIPFTVTIAYPNGAREIFSFAILEPYETWLPIVARTPTIAAPTGRDQGSALPPLDVAEPQAGSGWTDWSYVWAGGDEVAHHNEQRWYDQIASGDSPNTSDCWSGCGATAWAMLFGWADYQADLGDDPYWDGRWGLYRVDGGYGADAVAPYSMDQGVKNMIWEIRNHIDTWCSPLPWDDQAATWASDMDKAEDYVANRSYVKVFTWGNNWSVHESSVRNKAKTAIKYRGPAVIGIGLWEHYPLAYGYKQRKYRTPGVTWYTQRRFYVNKGWGSSTSRGWVSAFPIWFAGEIRPEVPVETNVLDDVALHRTSDHKWYYDFGHDGDTDTLSPAWGKQAGDVPLAGDFDRDGFVDDTAIFRLDGSGNGRWHYSYNHDGGTDEQSGPWGWSGDRPLVADFDRDGSIDDVAVYRPSTHVWYYDYDRNGNTDATSGPWGWADDLPFAGDFDRDGYVDDVALFRPSTHEVYYDYDHNGSTDEVVTHWTTETGLPVAGDFDRDGYMDDVVFFIPDWEPVSLWLFDYDHNGPPNDISEWGWEDALPVAGAFGENDDPE